MEPIEHWMIDMENLILRHESEGTMDMLVNCDEAAWRIVPSGLVTCAPVGRERVTVRLNGNKNDSVTFVASLTAAGGKLPVFAIAKGKTQRAEWDQLGSDPTIAKDHAPLEWKSRNIQGLSRLPRWDAGKVSAARPLDIVRDCDCVHRLEDVRDHAADLKIRLWFIPAGDTNELQPLDRAVFGAMKAMFRRRFESLHRQHPEDRVTKSLDLQIVAEIWENVGVASILHGWEIDADDVGPDKDGDDVD
jgi:hypothetical protein